ncbi:DNA mismatch repair protein Msh3 [Powellomyces hirtus]|nr:DNA mismatch repair protein Msh3 [Powellomyces hirtus]
MSGKRKASKEPRSASKKVKAGGKGGSSIQPTISSFFATKPATEAGASTQASSSPCPSPLSGRREKENDANTGNGSQVPQLTGLRDVGREPLEAAPLLGGVDHMDVDSPSPKMKRSRRVPLIVSEDEDEPPENPRIVRTAFAKRANAGRIMKRTEIYRYNKTRLLSEPNGHNMSTPAVPSAERDAMRSKFLEKFTIDEIAPVDPEQAIVHEDGSDGESEPVTETRLPVSRPKGSAIKKTPASKRKPQYTPLEQQFLEIKAQNPDCLLLIEVGYKFRFFGEDAKNAAKELNIVAYKDHSMYTAGIPTHRLHVHVQKLVQLGYKVGIVRQMETAALKAAGDNKSAPFVRKLMNVYTKGTFVDDLETDNGSFEPRSSYLLCINEELSKTGDGAHFSIVAVQLHTGDIIFDEFEDNHFRNELETRFMHIQPSEIILTANAMSDITEKLLKHLCETVGVTGDAVRVERVKDMFLDHSTARKALAEFYEKPLVDEGMRQDDGTLLGAEIYSQALSLPRRIITCLAALLKYLTQFGLENVLRLTKFFSPFASVAHMVLNANTLSSLEIFQNQTDYTEKGSLLWILDHTKTKFGRRLIKKWIGRPLVRIEQLQQRIDAVEELLVEDAKENPLVRRIKGLVCQLPDLERSIVRIHYGRCAPSELYNTLLAFEKITTSVTPDAADRFTSPLLRRIYAALPGLRKDISIFRELVDEEAARKNDKLDLFRNTSKWPEIAQLKENIVEVEEDLTSHLRDVRKELKKPSLAFVTVAGIEYLVEVPAAQAPTVPKSWMKISNTKAVSRFHTPVVIEKIKERDRFREQLTMACGSAYQDFLRQVADNYEQLRESVQSMATMDCLFSLATVGTQPGYCKPEFVTDATVAVEDGRHPMVESLIGDYVPNDIDLTNDRRCLLITGPNMGGKSSYVRQVALIVIMGQIGSYVPAKSAKLGIFESVHTRMGASDDLAGGQSTFMKELQETSDIMRVATDRSLVILDELGRGTSTHDGTAIAYAALRHFLTTIRSLTLFVTHYPILGQLEREFPGVLRNCHMAFHETEEGGEGADGHAIIFLYKLTNGLAHKSYGLNVARLANLPETLLAVAKQKAAELEFEMEQRKQENRQRQKQRVFKQILAGDAPLTQQSPIVRQLLEDHNGD